MSKQKGNSTRRIKYGGEKKKKSKGETMERISQLTLKPFEIMGNYYCRGFLNLNEMHQNGGVG